MWIINQAFLLLAIGIAQGSIRRVKSMQVAFLKAT
jgi:hypothetical protein